MSFSKKPLVVVSRCLGFGVCRWNGVDLGENHLVAKLRGEVDFLPVCPECEIGLGCPRPPIRLLRKDSAVTLIQPATGLDLTSEMVAFSEKFLRSLTQVDGFLLKRKSPSCGLVDIPVYAAPAAASPLNEKDSGLFARAAHNFFPDIPKIDEEFSSAENFLKLMQAHS